MRSFSTKKVLDYFALVEGVGRYVVFVCSSFFALFRHVTRWSLIQEQLYQIGVLSLPVISLIGFFTGLVLATQSYYQLYNKGLTGIIGLMIAKSMLTELGPVLTALMFTGRVGAAITAEIATMKVTEQIDALIAMAVNPQHFLVSPRLISGIIMLPLLSVYSSGLGIIGGFFVYVGLFHLHAASFWEPIRTYIEPFDFWMNFIKTFIFGIFITTICCYKGLITSGGAKDVGRSTTQAVVTCYIGILILNFFLTTFLYTIQSIFIQWHLI